MCTFLKSFQSFLVLQKSKCKDDFTFLIIRTLNAFKLFWNDYLMIRETWFREKEILMRTSADFILDANGKQTEIVYTTVSVYRCEAGGLIDPPIFISSSKLYSDTLDAQISEAENHGRVFIASLF